MNVDPFDPQETNYEKLTDILIWVALIGIGVVLIFNF
jgi:hypothetical protein